MPDRDAEIMAMVDEFLDEKPRTEAEIAARRKWYRLKNNMNPNAIFPLPDDLEVSVDETLIDDVLHSGVIGTEE